MNWNWNWICSGRSVVMEEEKCISCTFDWDDYHMVSFWSRGVQFCCPLLPHLHHRNALILLMVHRCRNFQMVLLSFSLDTLRDFSVKIIMLVIIISTCDKSGPFFFWFGMLVWKQGVNAISEMYFPLRSPVYSKENTLRSDEIRMKRWDIALLDRKENMASFKGPAI